MKKNFYIFLDYDGVLWDWVYVKELINNSEFEKGKVVNIIKPESMKALNFLIFSLQALDFEPEIVITSTVRLNDSTYNDFIKILYDNNLNYVGLISKTDNCRIRGKSIDNFLKNKLNYEYVVIDDEISDIVAYIPAKKIIKTNLQKNALSMQDVFNFLKSNYSVPEFFNGF